MYGLDYGEVFSLIAHFKCIRMLIVMAAQCG